MELTLANQVCATIPKPFSISSCRQGEDCVMITSNSFNFSTVVEGEEGWVEITIEVTRTVAMMGMPSTMSIA